MDDVEKKVFFQNLCAEVINDYAKTGSFAECEIIRRCYDTFKSLDTYKNVWYLKPWVVGIMLLRLGAIMAKQKALPTRQH